MCQGFVIVWFWCWVSFYLGEGCVWFCCLFLSEMQSDRGDHTLGKVNLGKDWRIHKEPKSVLSATQMYSNSLCRLLLLLTHQDAPALPVRLAFLLLDLIRLCFHLLVSHPDVDTLVIFLLGRCSLISHHLPGKQDVSFN